MSFSNSSVLINDNTGATFFFATNQSSPFSIDIPATATGTYRYAVSRAGQNAIVGSFQPSGGVFSFPTIQNQKLQPDGTAAFTNSNSSLVDVSFDLSTPGQERCFIDIGNGTATPQAILDEIEVALETEQGCKFLIATSGAEVSLAILPSGTFLFIETGYRLRRRTETDVNATVAGSVISTDGTAIDGENGSISLVGGVTVTQIAEAVWGASSETIGAVPASAGELQVKGLKTSTFLALK